MLKGGCAFKVMTPRLWTLDLIKIYYFYFVLLLLCCFSILCLAFVFYCEALCDF